MLYTKSSSVQMADSLRRVASNGLLIMSRGGRTERNHEFINQPDINVTSLRANICLYSIAYEPDRDVIVYAKYQSLPFTLVS